MGRSLAAQVRAVWSASRILKTGGSRFAEKQRVRDDLRAAGVGATAARIADRTHVASYRTYDSYRAVTAEFARFAADFGVNRVHDLRPHHAQAFITAKLNEGCSCNTLRAYAAALGKFDVALGMVPRSMRIPQEARLSPGLDAVRRMYNATAKRLNTKTRAYADPARLVGSVADEGYRLAASLQLQAGFRVSEVLSLNRASLVGETVDRVTGRWCGLVHVQGKGGYERTQFVPVATYRALGAHLDGHSGSMGVSYKPYLNALHRAADAVGEAWSGTHALRHNYVRSFLSEASARGLGTHATMREAMARVGHHRIDELRTYCR